MRATDVDLVEMGNAAVAGGDGDVFELDVHVVFGCFRFGAGVRVVSWLVLCETCGRVWNGPEEREGGREGVGFAHLREACRGILGRMRFRA